MPMQINGTSTPNSPPSGLAERQLSIEMGNTPPRLWVGCPTSIDASGRVQVSPPVDYVSTTALATALGSYLPLTGGWLSNPGYLTVEANQAAPITGDGQALAAQTQTGITAQSIYAGFVPAANYYYDGIRAAVINPNGSTTVNTNGLGAYVRNRNQSFGLSANAVGLFAMVTAEVADSMSWGLNTVCNDAAVGGAVTGLGGIQLWGYEVDFNVYSPLTTVRGVVLTGGSLVQPINANGFVVDSLSVFVPGTARWTNAFMTEPGVADVALRVGSYLATGTAVRSQDIVFNYLDAAGVTQAVAMHAAAGQLQVLGDVLLTGSLTAQGNAVIDNTCWVNNQLIVGAGGITSSGYCGFTGGVNISGPIAGFPNSLGVTGLVYIGSPGLLDGQLTVNDGILDVTATTVIVGGALSVVGGANFAAPVNFAQFAGFQQGVNIAGLVPSQTYALGVTGNAVATGNLTAVGNAKAAAFLNGSDQALAPNAANFQFISGAGGPTTIALMATDAPAANFYQLFVDVVSDAGVKHNIAPSAVDALAILRRMPVTQFDYDADNWHTAIGLVAQDIEELIPEMVGRTPDDLRVVNLKAAVPYLVRAIQQLAAEVAALQVSLKEQQG